MPVPPKVMLLALLIAESCVIARTPLLIAIALVKPVLAPERVNVPEPDFVRVPLLSESTELITIESPTASVIDPEPDKVTLRMPVEVVGESVSVVAAVLWSDRNVGPASVRV
jgi:hypothetical protein